MGLGKWSALSESLPGRIFISYRRQDTAWPAERLYDVMVEHFHAEQVFKDVDNIDPGDDFVERIATEVGSCDVLLALIGQQWLTITDENGQRRLDNPEDYVRVEIETALTRKIRVIPILVDDAPMPRVNELPATLAPLVRRNAVKISPQMFDTKRLITTVQQAAKLAADARLAAMSSVEGRPRGNAQSPNEAHYKTVAQRILAGAVVPFLGAGVNLCGRPDAESWQIGRYPPSNSELAIRLATNIRYPFEDRTNLLEVSQYAEVMLGMGPLYEELHSVFDADYPPTPVHRLLASLPSLIRSRPSTEPRFFPLIITTNYDDALERAFKDAGEEYDLVTYIADRAERGKFLHTSPDGVARIISKPASYTELRFDERPVIAKLNGTVGRGTQNQDSFVITEDHYIDYFSHADISWLIPLNIAMRLEKSHFLFLGYSLKEWNLRMILHRLWGGDGAGWNSWAIQPTPDSMEERSWYHRGVEPLAARLEEYIDLLGAALISAPAIAGETP
jgi:hypothetical protein